MNNKATAKSVTEKGFKSLFTLIELLVVIAMITILPLQNFKKPFFVICL